MWQKGMYIGRVERTVQLEEIWNGSEADVRQWEEEETIIPIIPGKRCVQPKQKKKGILDSFLTEYSQPA